MLCHLVCLPRQPSYTFFVKTCFLHILQTDFHVTLHTKKMTVRALLQGARSSISRSQTDTRMPYANYPCPQCQLQMTIYSTYPFGLVGSEREGKRQNMRVFVAKRK